MWAVSETNPVSAPFYRDVEFFGCQFHGAGDARVQRPRPVDLVVHPRAKIYGFAQPIRARNVTGVECLTGAGVIERALAFWGADAFKNSEVDGADLDGAFDDFDKVRMNPIQAHL